MFCLISDYVFDTSLSSITSQFQHNYRKGTYIFSSSPTQLSHLSIILACLSSSWLGFSRQTFYILCCRSSYHVWQSIFPFTETFFFSGLCIIMWCSSRMWGFCILASPSDMCMLTCGNHFCIPLLLHPLQDAAAIPSPPLVISCNKSHYFKLVSGTDCLLLLWLYST